MCTQIIYRKDKIPRKERQNNRHKYPGRDRNRAIWIVFIRGIKKKKMNEEIHTLSSPCCQYSNKMHHFMVREEQEKEKDEGLGYETNS